MLDLAYEKEVFISGSSILSITVYEQQLWNYYYTYVKRCKTDRLEFTTFRTAQGACAGKFKPAIKNDDLIFSPETQKRSQSDVIKDFENFKKKVSKWQQTTK